MKHSLPNFFIVLSVLFFLSVSPSVAAPSADVVLYEFGVELFQQGLYADALLEFNAALAINKDNQEAKNYVTLINERLKTTSQLQVVPVKVSEDSRDAIVTSQLDYFELERISESQNHNTVDNKTRVREIFTKTFDPWKKTSVPNGNISSPSLSKNAIQSQDLPREPKPLTSQLPAADSDVNKEIVSHSEETTEELMDSPELLVSTEQSSEVVTPSVIIESTNDDEVSLLANELNETSSPQDLVSADLNSEVVVPAVMIESTNDDETSLLTNNSKENLSQDTEASVSSSAVPEWLKRFEYALEVQSDQHPRYYVETIQPLYMADDDSTTIFTQARATYQNDKGNFSLGLGLRELINEEWIAGINSFVDYQELHKHYRTGIGLELIGKRFEGRVNTYVGLSPQRIIESTADYTIYEKAVDGIDYEFGTPLPYLSWLKVFAGGYWYNYETFYDKRGWSGRLEAKPSKYLTLDFKVFDDNKGEVGYKGTVAMRIPFGPLSPDIMTSAIKVDPKAYPDLDLRERRLDLVERSFEIEVEKYVKTPTVTFEIGRQ